MKKCGCCGNRIQERKPDPWEGRMDDYCYQCCLTRCDAYPGECQAPDIEIETGASLSVLLALGDRKVYLANSAGEVITTANSLLALHMASQPELVWSKHDDEGDAFRWMRAIVKPFVVQAADPEIEWLLHEEEHIEYDVRVWHEGEVKMPGGLVVPIYWPGCLKCESIRDMGV